MGGQIFKWQCFWWLRFAVVKWKMYSQSPFMWLCCLPPLSRSLCLTLMVCYKMWRVDVHLVTEKKIHFSYAPNFIWMTILPGQGLALSPSISFSRISISQFQSFILCSENSPLLKVGRPSLSAAVLKIIITHSASLYIYIYYRFISEWTMQKIKSPIPRRHELAHCLKICYWQLNPYHFVRRMNRLPFKSSANTRIWASELWKDAVTEKGLERAAERRTHAQHGLIWISSETILCAVRGTQEVDLGQRESPCQTWAGDGERFRECWSRFGLTNYL